MGLSDRSCGNGILYMIYRMLTILNNSIWYYFAPFVFKFGAYFWLIDQVKEFHSERPEGGED